MLSDEPKNRVTFAWTIYLASLVVVCLLIAYLCRAEKQLNEKIVNWSASVAASKILLTPEGPLAYLPMKQAVTKLQRAFERDPPEYGRLTYLPVNEAVTKLQRAIEQEPPQYGRVTITGTKSIPKDRNLELKISIDDLRRVQPMPFESLDLTFVRTDSAAIKLQVNEIKKGLFGLGLSSIAFTEEKRTPLQLLNTLRSIKVSLPVVDGGHPTLAIHANRPDLEFTLHLTNFDPDENSGSDARLITARSLFIGSPNDRAVRHIDSINFNDGDATDHIRIEPEHPWLAVIVVANRDLTRHLRCIRSDNGWQIGSYRQKIPTFAAITDASAALTLSFTAHHVNESVDYEIYAMSAKTDPSKRLLIWYLEIRLTPEIRDGRPIDVDAVRGRLQWLYFAMGVSLNRKDQKELSEAVVRDLVKSLQPQPEDNKSPIRIQF